MKRNNCAVNPIWRNKLVSNNFSLYMRIKYTKDCLDIIFLFHILIGLNVGSTIMVATLVMLNPKQAGGGAQRPPSSFFCPSNFFYS